MHFKSLLVPRPQLELVNKFGNLNRINKKSCFRTQK